MGLLALTASVMSAHLCDITTTYFKKSFGIFSIVGTENFESGTVCIPSGEALRMLSRHT